MIISEETKKEYKQTRAKLLEFLNIIDLLASKYHLDKEFHKERRIKTIEDFIIELLVTIPVVETWQDALKLYQGQQLAIFLMHEHGESDTAFTSI